MNGWMDGMDGWDGWTGWINQIEFILNIKALRPGPLLLENWDFSL